MTKFWFGMYWSAALITMGYSWGRGVTTGQAHDEMILSIANLFASNRSSKAAQASKAK